jgi:hypothetical protein
VEVISNILGSFRLCLPRVDLATTYRAIHSGTDSCLISIYHVAISSYTLPGSEGYEMGKGPGGPKSRVDTNSHDGVIPLAERDQKVIVVRSSCVSRFATKWKVL